MIIQTKNIIRVTILTVSILMIPLVAMQFTDGVVWDLTDFVVAGILLFSAGIAYELIVRKARNNAYRIAAGIAVVASLLLVWTNLAVGPESDNSGGLMYLGILVFGIGSIIARFRPRGMAIALFATALAQAIIAVIAMLAWQQYLELLLLNGFFISLWAGSALLFRRANSTD